MLMRDITCAAPADVVPSAMIESLLKGVGDGSFGDCVLQAANKVAEFNHCTLFEFHGRDAPSFIGLASCNSNRRIANSHSTEAYLGGFHLLDPARAVMHEKGEKLFIRYHAGRELQNRDYRQTCYELANIVDRFSIVANTQHGSWFVANLFRDTSQGPLPEGKRDHLASFAFLIALAGRRDIALRKATHALSLGRLEEQAGLLTARLSERERQVCSRILAGRTTSEIASELDIRESTVVTYRRRAYERLNIHGRRELKQHFESSRLLAALKTAP